MAVTESVQLAPFVVDWEDRPTAAVLDMSAWEVVLSMLLVIVHFA